MNELLKNVMEDDFTLAELSLYLDTHPACENGLRAWREARERAQASRAAYEAKCGPLTLSAAGGERCWDWVQRPWPWERED